MEQNIFFFIIFCIWGVIYVCLAIYIWFSKKAIGFWGNKKMFEVTDIRKYNHAMSKFYVVHGMVFIFLGLPLLVSAQVRYSQLFFLKIANYRSNHPTLSTNPWLFYRSSTS